MMAAEVLQYMPVELTGDLIRAVRQHPDTRVEDKDEENVRIGWLICAWDVLIEAQNNRALKEKE